MKIVRKNGISASARKVKAKKEDGCFQNATQRTLWLLHFEETFRKKAIPFPRGGGEGDNFVETVTNKGRLITTIDPKSKLISHTWEPWVRQK
jgi:hypothetical protein